MTSYMEHAESDLYMIGRVGEADAKRLEREG